MNASPDHARENDDSKRTLFQFSRRDVLRLSRAILLPKGGVAAMLFGETSETTSTVQEPIYSSPNVMSVLGFLTGGSVNLKQVSFSDLCKILALRKSEFLFNCDLLEKMSSREDKEELIAALQDRTPLSTELQQKLAGCTASYLDENGYCEEDIDRIIQQRATKLLNSRVLEGEIEQANLCEIVHRAGIDVRSFFEDWSRRRKVDEGFANYFEHTKQTVTCFFEGEDDDIADGIEMISTTADTLFHKACEALRRSLYDPSCVKSLGSKLPANVFDEEEIYADKCDNRAIDLLTRELADESSALRRTFIHGLSREISQSLATFNWQREQHQKYEESESERNVQRIPLENRKAIATLVAQILEPGRQLVSQIQNLSSERLRGNSDTA